MTAATPAATLVRGAVVAPFWAPPPREPDGAAGLEPARGAGGALETRSLGELRGVWASSAEFGRAPRSVGKLSGVRASSAECGQTPRRLADTPEYEKTPQSLAKLVQPNSRDAELTFGGGEEEGRDPSHSSESCIRVIHPSHTSESYIRAMHLSHASESYIRVTHPSHASESRIRVTHPSHASESRIRVMHPSHASESCIRVMHPSHESQSSIRVIHPSHGTGQICIDSGKAYSACRLSRL